MLTTVRAYSSWESVDTLLLADGGRAETDLIQIRKITGLEPVGASVNTSPYGSLDGDAYVGSSVGSRNIVMTVKPNPDWVDWTYEKLRRILYTYFMPRRQIRLVFETDEIAPVEITGYVESIEPDIFSKDGEIQISVICPYPHFVAVTPTVVSGLTNEEIPLEIDYDGSIETAYSLKVEQLSGEPEITGPLFLGNVHDVTFQIDTPPYLDIDSFNYLVINAVPGNKYIQMVNLNTGVITNVLSQLKRGSIWPMLQLGVNPISVLTAGIKTWTLTYYKRYGGL